MKVQSLRLNLAQLEEILGVRLPTGRVARALLELYVTKSAIAVLSCVRALYPDEIDTVRRLTRAEDQFILPNVDDVKVGAAKLLEAIADQDGNRAIEALKEMRVLALCPPPEKQFARLELCVGFVVGRPRLIPLIQLTLLAAESGLYDKASAYQKEAYAFAPEPPELHDLHTAAGIVALGTGQVAQARECLSESIRVCRVGEFARLMCSVRAFNLVLVEKLLECGERVAVVEYLAQCKDVWTHEAKRIVSWIEAIQNGEEPAFHSPSLRNALDKPAAKIQELVIRSSFLADSDSSIQKPTSGARGGLDEMRANYKRDLLSALKGNLKTEKN